MELTLLLVDDLQIAERFLGCLANMGVVKDPQSALKHFSTAIGVVDVQPIPLVIDNYEAFAAVNLSLECLSPSTKPRDFRQHFAACRITDNKVEQLSKKQLDDARHRVNGGPSSGSLARKILVRLAPHLL